jgi:hypothetical protein
MLLLLTLLFAQAAPAPALIDLTAAQRDDAAPAREAASDALATDPERKPAAEEPGTGPEPVAKPAAEEPATGPDPSEPEKEDEEPHSLDASLESAAGRMGERHVELLVRARAGDVTLVVGAETLASDRAPERRAVIFGAELARGDLSWEAELRTAPQAEGLSRTLARLGLHGDSAGVSLLGRDESLRGTRLRAAGLALDLERPLDEAWNISLSASGWLTDLSAPPQSGGPRRSRDPWGAFGAATLDWAERWELSVSARRALGRALSIAPGFGFAQPAQDGAAAARASLALEAQLGPARLALSTALAHLWPGDLWLVDAMLGVSWHVGDD